jgi:hypothetical protein
MHFVGLLIRNYNCIVITSKANEHRNRPPRQHVQPELLSKKDNEATIS